MHSHNHDHGHAHNHHHGVDAATVANSAFVIGIVLNLAYVIGEFIAGFYTNSVVLLSDAAHNLGDVGGLALSLLAFRLARLKPSSSYTYGYKKTTILAALANAVILLTSVCLLGYESVVRLRHPEPVQGGIIAWVAGAGIIVNGVSALLFFRHKDEELNMKGAYLHLMMDAMVSLCVVAAGVAIHFTGWQWLDPAVSIVVLGIVTYSTWNLLTGSLKMSMDAVPENIDTDEIETVIRSVKGVEGLHHMHIWPLSTTETALTAHVILATSLSFEEKMKCVHEIKHELEHHNIHHATIELESAELPCHEEGC